MVFEGLIGLIMDRDQYMSGAEAEDDGGGDTHSRSVTASETYTLRVKFLEFKVFPT